MRSADIEVGKTYLYQRDSYSPCKVVRVERILTQAERFEEVKAEGNVRRGSRWGAYSDTIEVTFLFVVTTGYSGDKNLERIPEVQEWVRPVTILESFTVLEAT